jgi:ribosomal protein L16 Arg81 hydroxylase
MSSLRQIHSAQPVTPEWRRWLAENLMLNTDRTVLVDTVVSLGCERAEVEHIVDDILADGTYQAGSWIAARLFKLESLLAIYGDLARLVEPGGTIDRRIDVDGHDFLYAYYARNRPLVITGLARPWAAFELWSPEYLRDTCPDELIEVMAGREADRRFEVNSEAHKTRMRFADYVEHTMNAACSNDSYLVANNRFFDLPGTRQLLNDLAPLPSFIDSTCPSGSVFLWFGPAGTITPLHHDTMNVLFVQIKGRKRIRLIPSYQIPFVYNEVGVFSEVDLENVDATRHPLASMADEIDITLEPGDALFIPVGWWHHVRSLELSISVSFTNFTFPNDYRWQHPAFRG